MENKDIKIVLAGNPNSGKTTLFNSLTGLKQKVGNYPGITVEKKSANINVNGYKSKISLKSVQKNIRNVTFRKS